MFSIEDEFRKNSELKEEDLEQLRQWLSKQPHLPKVPDEFLALFLHSNFFRSEPTKSTIDSYYTIRTHAPEIFANRNLSDVSIQEALKTVHFSNCPGETKDGYVVSFFRLARTEPEFYVLADVLKVHHMIRDLWHAKYGSTAGDVIICDMTGTSFGHIGRINMSVMKKNLIYLQANVTLASKFAGMCEFIRMRYGSTLEYIETVFDANEGIPIRLKAIHLMNTVPFIDVIMNMMKPFMKNELLNKFHYHSVGSEELFKYVPKEMIPSDSGGTGKPIAEMHNEVMKMLEENREYFKQEESQRVDESRRPGKAKNSSDLFGVEGSFKKLSVD